MSVGKISSHVLTDIANAIRYQNGTATLYKPGAMAAAVTALDGTNAGAAGTQGYLSTDVGTLSAGVFTDVANAIRAQNGLTTKYKPGEMAQAIRDLVWDVGLKPRAVLLSNGTLEFNYLDGRQSKTSGTIVTAYEVPTAGFASSTARGWDSVKGTVTKVVIDSSFASAGVTNCDFWFLGCGSLVAVSRFDYLAGITSAKQMFSSCTCLETISATSFDSSTITTSTSIFSGCYRLVGSTGYVPTSTATASVLKLGDGGVLSKAVGDGRSWCDFALHSTGVLEIDYSGVTTYADDLLTGHVCAGAHYNALGAMPWYGLRASITSVKFSSGIAYLPSLNMDYWFDGLSSVTSVTGMGSIHGACEMNYAFANCTGLTTIDLVGFSPSTLTTLTYTFSGCKALTTIKVSSTWALPSTASGSGTFYGCTALVGGNGRAYASSRITYKYMVVDKAGSVGYLTAG
jgi:hypothetical protein